jgi:predicted NBD/HSP70 family sugar kinase
MVQPYFDCPVFVENDARAGAVAELWFAEEARGLNDFIYVLVCEGVGSGTVIHRKLYTGARYLEGIFYSGSVDIEGELEAPSRGTNWEDRASYPGIVQRYCQLTGDTRQNDLESQANAIIDLAVDGDTRARKALRETAKWLGAGLANINNGLDPERIILAGHIVKAWKLIYPELLGQLRAGAPFPMEHLPDLIVPCSLDKPTEYGARALILQHMMGGLVDGQKAVQQPKKQSPRRLVRKGAFD